MEKEFITIQEASEISGKSIQTIRRAIKSKKLKSRRQKTPQGFNYMINRSSLFDQYSIKVPGQTEDVKVEVKEELPEKKIAKKDSMNISSDDFKAFAETMENLMTRQSDERQNFLRLMNTLQERVFFLENQLNLLKAPEKRWYQVWK